MPTFRRRRWRPSPQIQLERIAQGEAGERALQDWLDRSRLAYLYLDQTPLTIPAAHRTHIKRPDFLVAVDGIGTVAVDAKAKNFVADCFVLDVAERRRLDGFESMFEIPVWYACFPPTEPRLCYLFRNRDLMARAVVQDADQQILYAPLQLGCPIGHTRVPFQQALLSASPPR
jgi:hypothetical protein